MARLNRPPPQVVRLLLLTALIVGTYLIARYLLTPGSFGEYGFYRGASLTELSAREPMYAGAKTCLECHEEEVKKLAGHGHKSLSCEGCHGAGKAHAENPDVKLEVLSYSLCVRCHEASPSRPKFHKQVVTKEHYPGSKCSECHVPHMPEEVP